MENIYLVKIKRETSKYNKYMLWKINGEANNGTGARFADYTKTLQQARDKYNKEGYKVIEIDKGNGEIYKNIAYK